MPIDLKLFNEISAKTPNLCHLAPAGPTHMPDLYAAGGIPAVQAELAKKGPAGLGRAHRHRQDPWREHQGCPYPEQKRPSVPSRTPTLRPAVCRSCGATLPRTAVWSSAALSPRRCSSIPARRGCSTARRKPSPPSTRARSSRAMWWSSATKAPRAARYAGDAQPHLCAGRHEAG